MQLPGNRFLTVNSHGVRFRAGLLQIVSGSAHRLAAHGSTGTAQRRRAGFDGLGDRSRKGTRGANRSSPPAAYCP